MANYSLDDYIRQKGIGLNTKRTITKPSLVGHKMIAGDSSKTFSSWATATKGPPKFDARNLISKPAVRVTGTASHLGGAKPQNMGGVQRSASSTALGVGTASNKFNLVSDARQKILAKTKFGDAREKILMKKIQNEAAAGPGFDVRQKLKAKQRLSVQSSQPFIPKVIIGPEGASSTVIWNAPNPPQNLSISNAGVTNFGGSLQRTVSNRAATHFGTGPISMADPISVNIQNPLQFPGSANITANQSSIQTANFALKKRFMQETVPVNPRIPFDPISEQRPIQTVISQPPVKVVNRPNVSSLSATRLQATAAKKSDVESVSPLQGFCVKISNLHPSVSQEDIIELFAAVGALRRTRLVRPGYAEVIFVNYKDAAAAVARYHMRELDGLPMNLLFDERHQSSVLLASAPSGGQFRSSIGLNESTHSTVVELEPSLLTKALFEVSSDQAPRSHVTFTVRV